MKISDIRMIEGMRCLQDLYEDCVVKAGYASDLLEDVSDHAARGAVLITVQACREVVVAAVSVGIVALVICNDHPVPDDLLEEAAKVRLAVFVTSCNQFEISALLSRRLAGVSLS